VSPSELTAADAAPVEGESGAGALVQAQDVHTCWNETGVYGNASCGDLKKFNHCRNCPVYSAAAVQLLDRPLLPEYRREWTERFCQPRQVTAPPKASGLVFRIHVEWLAMPTEALQEVAEHRPIHSLPHRRQGSVLGLVNIRGELLICVSLGHVLGLEQTPPAHTLRRACGRLLVTNWDGHRLVLAADEVQGIHRFQLSGLQEPPATLVKSRHSYTQGLLTWQGRTVGFLDAERLFAALNRSLT
jgi:chemotaxis-related protein WspD